MATKHSAGLLAFRWRRGRLEVLLGHPGGPFWRGRDQGVWTIPKGGIDAPETALTAAIREFREETGFEPAGPFLPLGRITQRGGKVVEAWAFEGDYDPARAVSAEASVEWPPQSGRRLSVPELDRVAYFEPAEAGRVINAAQAELLDRLRSHLAGSAERTATPDERARS